jgi:peptidoglycan/xylan/chitin deacetylase (PgdA/CDA1 family)
MSLQVAITFDIEFSINGAFDDPETRRPLGRESLLCRMEGREAGIGTVLNILNKHGLKATFFIEALQTAWFDDDEMGDVAQRIEAEGHELQLHLHPAWLQFDNPDWADAVQKTPPVTNVHDSLLALPAVRALDIVERGKAVFERWSLPTPTAVRTGNLIMDRALYKVFGDAGLTVSSSVGCGIYQPEDPELDLYAAPQQFDGVMEIPVSSYWGANPLLLRRKRLATIQGLGSREQRALIKAARKAGLPFLVILSHISELCSVDYAGVPHPNVHNLRKLEQLCRTISQSPNLEAATINQLAKKFSDDTPLKDKRLQVSRLISATRFLEGT